MTVDNAFEELRGRRVLVTGASSGIGSAIALAFGRHLAEVAVHYNSNSAGAEATVATIKSAGGKAFALQSDLSVRGAGAQLVTDAAFQLGGLDLLVNNAGDMLARLPLADVDEEHLDAMIDLNIRPMVSACRAAVPLLRQSRCGSIINITSISARAGGTTGANLYAAAKGFQASYTRGLARELAPIPIRVNAIAPGIIDTPLHANRTPPAQFAQFASAIPLGYVGTPEECAGAALFLACHKLSSYMTGHTLEVNGGLAMS